MQSPVPPRPTPLPFLERGGAWVLCQIVLMVAALALGLAGPDAWAQPWTPFLGAALIALGAAFGIAGAAVLGRNRTIYPKPHPDSRLVCHGIYRLVRHPLYTCVILLTIGLAVCSASTPALIASAILALFLRAKAGREERWLVARFPDYESYRRRVKRFVPWIY